MSNKAITNGQVTDEAVSDFATSLRGEVVSQADDSYDEARSVWNGLVDAYPTLIVRCRGSADVAKGVEFATTHDLPFSVRGGAHNQTGSSMVEEGIVLDLAGIDHVRVNPEEQVAQVGAGCRARDALIETQHYGLAMPTGSAGDVGIPGSTLGGAIGWMRRKHGLGIDALQSVDVVTPNGELVTASESENEDLFWAVRGGGGNFGVVTNFEFELYEVPPIVAGLGIFYPGDDATEVFENYRKVTADAPDEVTTIALNSHVPDLPPMPEELVGKDAVAVLGCYIGDDPEEGMEALQPFRELADESLLDMSEPMPYLMLHQLGTMMFPEGRNYCHRSCFVDDLSDDLIDAILDHTEAAESNLSGVGVWQMGGAISDVDSDATAYPHRDAEYMITVEANWDDGDDDANIEWTREGDDLLRSLGGYGAYGGFTGVVARESENVPERVYGENLERLADIKARYDASNDLDKNVNVAPADD
ncbi:MULTISPECIES: FAD-binding oxidoreductase [Haloferax]|uniref:FAD-binding protein n=1 Tax=Haloferax marinum TaxID=2666143 RepID=A0A6A8G9G2_9EURY|nr:MULTISPECIES: FAD-binding oxidoreductase [Haloferax]KAB1197859.1 FAD-binding oxidoreductase [Haloferax sp. CBA1150]MRW96923.1 FAD-binding protein [Haloferax marinum]